MFSCIRRTTGDLVSFIPYIDIETDSTYIAVTHHNQSLPFPITMSCMQKNSEWPGDYAKASFLVAIWILQLSVNILEVFSIDMLSKILFVIIIMPVLILATIRRLVLS